MIPVDTNCEAGPFYEVARGYNRGGSTGDREMGRETVLPRLTKGAMRSRPRRSTRLAATKGGVFKRCRRALKLPPPTGRMIQSDVRVTGRSRTIDGKEEETSMATDAVRSEVNVGSTALAATELFDDAVVPRCDVRRSVESGRLQESGSDIPSPSVPVILSAPVAPKDAKRPCFCHHHHHLQQPEHHHHHHLHSRPPHHQHPQQQDQQQQHHHLSPGCQMSTHPSSLVGRVPASPARLINIPIPDDPRQWSRLDVRTWLDHVRRVYNIRDLDLDRFPMNGKALCIMTKDMFVYRVPHGGVPLYIDFQLRFRRALSALR